MKITSFKSNLMNPLYNTPENNQAQNNGSYSVLNSEIIADSQNALKYKPKRKTLLENNFVLSGQPKRIKSINRKSRRQWKEYLVQVFLYSHVGLGRTKEWGYDYIIEWIMGFADLKISPRMLYEYLQTLRADGYLKIKDTKYLSPEGKMVRGHNKYTLLAVDDEVRAWRQDKPLLSIGEKFANTLNNNLTVIRTSNITIDSLDKISKVKDNPVRKRRPKDPNRIIDPMEWEPRGTTEVFLTSKVGPKYLQQRPYIEEYQRRMALLYPNGIVAREMSYKFFKKLPDLINGRERFGDAYTPEDKRLAWKMKPKEETKELSAEEVKTAQTIDRIMFSVHSTQIEYEDMRSKSTPEEEEELEAELAVWYEKMGTNPPSQMNPKCDF